MQVLHTNLIANEYLISGRALEGRVTGLDRLACSQSHRFVPMQPLKDKMKKTWTIKSFISCLSVALYNHRAVAFSPLTQVPPCN